jgi:hypothetical protein
VGKAAERTAAKNTAVHGERSFQGLRLPSGLFPGALPVLVVRRGEQYTDECTFYYTLEMYKFKILTRIRKLNLC